MFFSFINFDIIAEEYKFQIFYLEQEVTEQLDFYKSVPHKFFRVSPYGLKMAIGPRDSKDFLIKFKDIASMLNLNTKTNRTANYISIKAYNDAHEFYIDHYLDGEDNTTYINFYRTISRHAQTNNKDMIEIRRKIYEKDEGMSDLREENKVVHYILVSSRLKNNELYIPIISFLGLLEYELDTNINENNTINIKSIISERIREEIKGRYSNIAEEIINSSDFNYNRAERMLEYLDDEEINLSDDEIKNMFLGNIWFGMRQEHFKAIKGKPNQINITYHTENDLHEQWVYGTRNMTFYYFENGILTTMQRF